MSTSRHAALALPRAAPSFISSSSRFRRMAESSLSLPHSHFNLRRRIAFVKSIDHPAPGLALAVVDLAEIKHRTLHHSTAGAALTLDNAPVTVLLAVLPSSSESQIHRRRFYSDQNARKGSRSSLQRLSLPRPL